MIYNQENVTIIVPVRNRYDHRIINLLQSLKTQNYDQALIKVIIVDYGSDPKCYFDFVDVCRSFDAQGIWSNVNAQWNKAHCLNIAIRRVRTKYVLIADVDIIFESNYIQTCVSSLQRSPWEMLYCGPLDIPEQFKHGALDLPADYERLKSISVYRGKQYNNASYRYGLGILFLRTDILKDMRGYDEHYELWGKEDDDLAKRLELGNLSVRNISPQTSYLHQWHVKHEGVNDIKEFKTSVERNNLHFKRSSSVKRNSSDWGLIKADKTKGVPEFLVKLPGTIWGITTLYNPADYANKLENYKKFRENSKKQGLNLLVVEIAYEGQSFKLKREDADILVQIKAEKESILWQKEALLNIGLRNLPQDCDKIVWLDCDILFKNELWLKETCSLLERFEIVQPYSHAIRMSKDQLDVSDLEQVPAGYKENEKFYSLAYGVSQNGSNELLKYSGHVGYAWAARRSIFEEVGFYDRLILGGGDIVMSYAFYGNDNSSSQKALATRELRNDYNLWSQEIYERVSSSVYYTQGCLLHLWHGSRESRIYHLRYKILKFFHYDPRNDISKSSQGILKWSSNKVKFHRVVSDYFEFRNEEGKDSRSVLWRIYLFFLSLFY